MIRILLSAITATVTFYAAVSATTTIRGGSGSGSGSGGGGGVTSKEQQGDEAVVRRRMRHMGNGNTDLDCVLTGDDLMTCTFTASVPKLETFVEKYTSCVASTLSEPTSVTHDGNQKFDMQCPRLIPNSLGRCGGWMPPGATVGTCLYDNDTTCDCVDTNSDDDDDEKDANKIYWDCGDIDPAELETMPVDVTLNALTGPDPEDIVMNVGVIFPALRSNNDACPEFMPVTREALPGFSAAGMCTSNLHACSYYDDDTDDVKRTRKIIHCRCNNALAFYCKEADALVYYPADP